MILTSEAVCPCIKDEELARVIPDFDMIIAALKLEYNPQRLEELKT